MADRFHVVRNGTRVVVSRRRQGAAGDADVVLADGITVGVDLLDAGVVSSLVIPDARSAAAGPAWSVVFGDRYPAADGWFEPPERDSDALAFLSHLARARHHGGVDYPARALLWAIDEVGDWAALRAAAPAIGVVLPNEQVERVRRFLLVAASSWAGALRTSDSHGRALDRVITVARDLAGAIGDEALRSVAVALSALRHEPPDIEALFEPPLRVAPPSLVSLGTEVPLEITALDEYLSLRLVLADVQPMVTMTGIELTIALPLEGVTLPEARTADLRWLLLEPGHDDPVLGIVRAEVSHGALRGRMYVPADVAHAPERVALLLVRNDGLTEGVFHERRKAQVLTYVGARLLSHPDRQQRARGLLRAALAVYEDARDESSAEQVRGLLAAPANAPKPSTFLADLVDDGSEPGDVDA